MPTIVDIFENLLGETLTLKTLPLGKRLSKQQLDDLIWSLNSFDADSWSTRDSLEERISTFVPKEIGFAELRDIGVARYIEMIQNHLLYYPRIHVTHHLNPLSLFFNLSFEEIDLFVEVYATLRDLIQEGILVVSTWPDTGVSEPIIEELNEIDSDDQELLSFVSKNRSSNYYPQSLPAVELIDEYHITQVVASLMDVSWTAKYRDLLSIHEFKMKRMEKELSSIDKVELTAMDLFGRLSLPSINNISPYDLVRIRLTEDSFYNWRNSLTSIIRKIPIEVRHSSQWQREFTQQARLEMQPALNSLIGKRSSKSLRTHIHDSAIGFSAGVSNVLLESSAISSTNIREGLLKLGISTSTALLASILFRSKNKCSRNLLKFYSLFDEESAIS